MSNEAELLSHALRAICETADIEGRNRFIDIVVERAMAEIRTPPPDLAPALHLAISTLERLPKREDAKQGRAAFREMLHTARRIAHYARENVERQGASDTEAVAHLRDAEAVLAIVRSALCDEPAVGG